MGRAVEPDERDLEELIRTIHGLRWLLTGLRANGVESWLARPPGTGGAAQTDGTAASEASAVSPPLQPDAGEPAMDDGGGNAPGDDTGSGFPPEAAESGDAEGVSTPEESLLTPRLARPCRPSLDAIRLEMGDCSLCRLHSTRTRLVFGEGFHETSLVFVGEGPGFDEDRQGRPFVGRAGKLLDKMIRSVGLRREEVYICNVVKCRPPKNRTPNPDEIASCSPFLFRQLEAIQPRVICALGACAAQTLLKTSQAVGALRNKVHYRHGIPLIVTYHPAYLLRTPAQKAATWQDLREVRRILNARH